MTTIAFTNHKGGTGKTTSALNVAAAMGMVGIRTLIVDLDPQGFLTGTLGIREPPPHASTSALFLPDVDPSTIPYVELSDFDLMPSSGHLTKQLRHLNKPTDVLWVREALSAQKAHDAIILDTAAALTVFSLNAVVAADFVVIPVTPEVQPLRGAEQTWKTVRTVSKKLNPKLGAPYFLLTQVDARKRVHNSIREYLRQRYSEYVLQQVIRTNAALAASYDSSHSIFRCAPKSRGALDYANLTDELISTFGMGGAVEADGSVA